MLFTYLFEKEDFCQARPAAVALLLSTDGGEAERTDPKKDPSLPHRDEPHKTTTIFEGFACDLPGEAI